MNDSIHESFTVCTFVYVSTKYGLLIQIIDIALALRQTFLRRYDRAEGPVLRPTHLIAI